VPGVLDGTRVLELAGIGPGPHAAMLLADLGCDVVRVERPTAAPAAVPAEQDYVLRNRRSVGADLKDPDDRDMVVSLADRADVLLEGYRPGVAERLGLGPDVLLERNPRLVYGRMTGWGQDGPLARVAGHDINYLGLTGALAMIGREGERPLAPLNLVGDYGGGSLYLVIGILGALLERTRSGRGQVVDAAMVDGVSSLMAMYWNMVQHDAWTLDRGTNTTDGGAPFYDTYACADGRFVAVGAVEPQFYAALLRVLGLDGESLPAQMDRAGWPRVRARLTEVFATRPRDAWTEAFAGVDACVTPVLALDEVSDDAHLAARGTIAVADDGERLPAAAPRFSRSDAPPVRAPSAPGADTAAVLADWGTRARS